jgi:hypothetical protein
MADNAIIPSLAAAAAANPTQIRLLGYRQLLRKFLKLLDYMTAKRWLFA